MDIRIAKNPISARLAFAGATDGVGIHGITDGTWSLIDAIRELLSICGPAHMTLATWTASTADLWEAERMLRARNLIGMRLLVDRSFQSRQPKYCSVARQLFGDDSIRVWNAHCKFAVIEGERHTALYLTSANLNRNSRVESFSLFFSAGLAASYLELVDSLFNLQAPGDGFLRPQLARAHTAEVLNEHR